MTNLSSITSDWLLVEREKGWGDGKFQFLFYKLIASVYIKECIHSLTHSLTQHGPGSSTENWVTNFGVQIGLEALTSNKTWF